MKIVSILVSTAVLAATLALSLPGDVAYADISPRPPIRVEPVLPEGLERWFELAERAMKDKDRDDAEALCDPRGYDTNLIGGSGTTLASLFEQGGRKGWHLELLPFDVDTLAGKRALIVGAEVRDNDDGDKLDGLHILLIRSSARGAGPGWRALGAGERKAEVEALAERYLGGKALPPPATKDRREPEP